MDNALKNFEIAFKKGFNDYNRIQRELDNSPIINLPEWKELMKKYFP